jgi:transposase InsO family protein
MAERVIGEWIDFCNADRPHSALAAETPAEAYDAGRHSCLNFTNFKIRS